MPARPFSRTLGRPYALAATLALAAFGSAPARAQLYDQTELAALLYARRDSLEDLPEVRYRTYTLEHETGNSVLARMELYKMAGRGDQQLGRERLAMAAFFNRVRIGDLSAGDTLVLPTVPEHFDLDPRAYAPFPRYYEGARGLDKLFIIHKGVQAWAAYEHGELERWGLVNTGGPESRTPAGRFNFNWQEPERVSTLSPPGERWLMRWVSNFYHERGIHIHQYSMPTGEPGSHGCVRMILADARWAYDWIDTWTTTAGPGERGLPTADGRITRQGTMVLVLGDGEEPRGPVQRFVYRDGQPTLRTVALPADPYSVPAGSPQQQMFDRQRRARPASASATPVPPTRPAAARPASGRDVRSGRVGRTGG